MLKSSRFDWRFWIVTLSALTMAALTFGLGLWQLDRASEKKKITQERREALPLNLSGQWLVEQTRYIDNRQMNAKLGFFVVTPLKLSESEYVLVERGWIARDFMDRQKLQLIQTPREAVTITARQLPDPVRPSIIADNAASEHPIVQFIDLKSLKAMGGALPSMTYKGYVQQLGGASEGLKREWYEPSSGIEKHYGYAFQWFALCALLIGLYIWYQWIKK